MRKLKLIPIFLLGVVLSFASCEAEEINPISSNGDNEKIIVKTSKALGTKEKKAKRDSQGSLKKCKSTPKDCDVFVTMPTELELNALYFDGSGIYIDNSFNNNYSNALNHFTEIEIDNVINGVFTVSQIDSDDVTFIVFQSLDGTDEAVYQYGE